MNEIKIGSQNEEYSALQAEINESWEKLWAEWASKFEAVRANERALHDALAPDNDAAHRELTVELQAVRRAHRAAEKEAMKQLKADLRRKTDAFCARHGILSWPQW